MVPARLASGSKAGNRPSNDRETTIQIVIVSSDTCAILARRATVAARLRFFCGPARELNPVAAFIRRRYHLASPCFGVAEDLQKYPGWESNPQP